MEHAPEGGLAEARPHNTLSAAPSRRAVDSTAGAAPARKQLALLRAPPARSSPGEPGPAAAAGAAADTAAAAVAAAGDGKTLPKHTGC